MKKGFTLLELIVVIIIIGILATLGFSQYTRMIERSRGAEARSVLGNIRTQAAALWIERSAAGVMPAADMFTNDAVGIGVNAGQISSDCAGTSGPGYFFSYDMTASTTTGFTATAVRCIAGGKAPVGPAALTLTLTTDFALGQDTWGGTGGY